MSVGSDRVRAHGRAVGLREGVDRRAGRCVAARRSQRRRVLADVDRHRVGREDQPARACRGDGVAAAGGHLGGVATRPARAVP